MVAWFTANKRSGSSRLSGGRSSDLSSVPSVCFCARSAERLRVYSSGKAGCPPGFLLFLGSWGSFFLISGVVSVVIWLVSGLATGV